MAAADLNTIRSTIEGRLATELANAAGSRPLPAGGLTGRRNGLHPAALKKLPAAQGAAGNRRSKIGGASGIRTPDQVVKSHLLYR